MPGFNITIPFVFGDLVRVAIILVAAFVLLLLIKGAIPRIIRARLPRPREISEEQIDQRANTVSAVLNRWVTVLVWLVAIMMALGALRFDITPILASIGVIGLALGLAAQNIIRDYLHGLFIVMEDWYRVGEVARVAGIAGLVDDLNLRRTVLRDLDGTMHIIPNSNIPLASNLTREWSRVNLNISVGYGEDLEHVFRVINEVCQQLKDDETWGPDLLTLPRAERVDNFGASGIEIKILGDTKPIRQWAVMGEIRRRLKIRFDQEKIEIPWPHTKVYFGNSPSMN